MFREQVVVDARLVVETFEIAGRDQLDEIAIAFESFAQQNQVIAAATSGLGVVMVPIAVGTSIRRGFFAAIVAAAFGHVHFAANDGLHIALAGFVEEIGGGEEVAVVGNRHRRHFLARSFVE